MPEPCSRLALVWHPPEAGSSWPGGTEPVEICGAKSHCRVPESPLTAYELAELESPLGVELPAECRSFLLQVSHGGAGPGYGLFPLRPVDGRWNWHGDGASRADDAAPIRSFGRSRASNPGHIRVCNPGHIRACNPGRIRACNPGRIRACNPMDDQPSRPHPLHNEAPTVRNNPVQNHGLLTLCHPGCALVRGPGAERPVYGVFGVGARERQPFPVMGCLCPEAAELRLAGA
jgi:hypothetical protein